MGSFNVSCSISKISISPGDPIVYIPLELHEFSHELKSKDCILIYPWCFYSPVTLPIIGSYGDYGEVDNIEMNRNIEIIEDHFKIKIRNIIEDCPDPIDSGMFIHRDIYDFLVNSNVDEWGGKNGDLLTLESVYDDFVNQIIKSREKQELYNSGETSVHFESFFLVESHNVFNFRRHKTFQKIYRPLIESKIIKKELIDMVKMEINVGQTNSFYFPGCNGPQFGNNFASRLLTIESKKILNEKIIKYFKFKISDWAWTIKWKTKELIKKIF